MKVTVKEKEKAKVTKYLNEAINLYKPGTTSLEGENIFRFERIVYILGNLIRLEGFPYNTDQKRGLISVALGLFKRYRRRSLAYFNRAIQVALKSQQKVKPHKYYVIFPWNIYFESLKGEKQFVVNGSRLEVRPYKHICKVFEFKKPIAIMRRYGEFGAHPWEFSYIIIQIRAKNSADALYKAEADEEILRALFNFVLYYGKVTWQAGYPSALSYVNPSKSVFIFDKDKRYLSDSYNVGEFNYRPYRLTQGELKDIVNIVKKFESLEKCSLKEILIESLRLYNYALDEIRSGFAFLHLWQILELIGLGGYGGNRGSMEEVKKRIKAIFLNNPSIADSVEAIFQKRNQLVHEGKISLFSLEDVNQIKAISEACIAFLFSQVNRLKNRDALSDFYESIELSSERLNKRIAIAKYARKLQLKRLKKKATRQ